MFDVQFVTGCCIDSHNESEVCIKTVENLFNLGNPKTFGEAEGEIYVEDCLVFPKVHSGSMVLSSIGSGFDNSTMRGGGDGEADDDDDEDDDSNSEDKDEERSEGRIGNKMSQEVTFAKLKSKCKISN